MNALIVSVLGIGAVIGACLCYIAGVLERIARALEQRSK